MAKSKAANEQQVIRQIDVTGLTCSQRRELFKDYLNRAGFIGFIKRSEGKQIIYTFTYQTMPNKHSS